jgi:hypothetical protein
MNARPTIGPDPYGRDFRRFLAIRYRVLLRTVIRSAAGGEQEVGMTEIQAVTILETLRDEARR